MPSAAGASTRLVMIAPPGAGKGTQASRLAARYGIEHIASGELLRSEVERATPAGRRAADYLRRGDLVPDDVVVDMVMARVEAAVAAGGFVLDGFPRNRPQAEAAYRRAAAAGAQLQAAVLLEVDLAELRRRLLGRARREDRVDDTPEVIEHRLAVYAEETAPVVELYRERGILRAVDGNPPPDEVYALVVGAIADLVPAVR